MERINNFVDFRTELVEESTKKDEAETAQECSSNRTGDELDQERSKKQKMEDDKESEELKKYLEIILDDGDYVTLQQLLITVSTNKGRRTISKFSKQMVIHICLKINLHKSKLMGIMVLAASSIGCSTLSTPFNYLGLKVGGIMSRHSSWDDVIAKLTSRLSKWKLKTLFIGDRLTLIKSVLSSLQLYHVSIFKVLKVIHSVRGALDSSHTFSRQSPWLDIIRGFQTLSNNDNDLFSLVKKSGKWRAPRGGIKEEQLHLLVASTFSGVLPQISDRWV
nr:RNA-directed DNA polymerase, eukaryota [Tanacetum cinerariifolium]